MVQRMILIIMEIGSLLLSILTPVMLNNICGDSAKIVETIPQSNKRNLTFEEMIDPSCFLPDGWACWLTDIRDPVNCIKFAFVCDGWKDCLVGEDEFNCRGTGYTPCLADQTKCGNTKRCVPNNKSCDGKPDCPGGEDEAVCAPYFPIPFTCPIGQFSCDGVCKPAYMVCNRRFDCFDKTDEPPACERLRVYQVNDIDVETNEVFAGEGNILITWWMDTIDTTDSIQFLPQVCDIESPTCFNATQWATGNTFIINPSTMNTELLPHWYYTVSVFVQVGTTVYYPGVTVRFKTIEARPRPPYNFQVSIHEKQVYLTWNRPCCINGDFYGYQVYITPSVNWYLLETTKHELLLPIDGYFSSGVDYIFTVSTIRLGYMGDTKGESWPSFPAFMMFHEVSKLRDDVIHIIEVTQNATSLQWESSGNFVDEYNLTVFAPEYADTFFYTILIKENTHQLVGLNPSTEYNITVTPLFKGQFGSIVSRQVTTTGVRPEKVKKFTASCEGPTTIQLTWEEDTTNSEKTYKILMWKENLNLYPKEITGENGNILLQGLESCTSYWFRIVAELEDVDGSPNVDPVSVTTGFDPKSPPKHVLAGFNISNPQQLVIRWSAPCSYFTEPLNYIIRFKDRNHPLPIYVEVNIVGGLKSELSYGFPPSYGSTYELQIRTTAPAAVFSEKIVFNDAGIPYVEEISQVHEATGNIVIKFTPPKLPPFVLKRGRVLYKVWISIDKDFKTTSAIYEYPAETNPIRVPTDKFDKHKTNFVTVVIIDGIGYKSQPAFYIPVSMAPSQS